MPDPAYIIGIDLGTTNSAVAFVELKGDAEGVVTDFPIPQLVRVGEVASRSLLPSCLYVPGEHELPAGSARLPWGDSPRLIAGEFARWQGTHVPGRLIASAKSWLCHPGVNRTAEILPWGAPPETGKISPVEASSQILSHLAAAWNHAHPQAPMQEQEVVLTIPASFDEAARALTVTAARRAGLEKLLLVEEPQAAFYDFITQHRRHLNQALDGVRLALVIDVGGGTTDFTLIQVAVSAGDVSLRRIAVGEHLMLGGDNMDAALARRVEERLNPGGRKLNAAYWHQLTLAARSAKETLLGAAPPERQRIALAGSGSRLLGATLSAELERDEVRDLLLDGFFPAVDPAAGPMTRDRGRAALQELGLPYAHDPAITRHLATFLTRHRAAGFAALGIDPAVAVAGLPRPDAILLNGGVFNSATLTEHLIDTVSSWWAQAPRIRLLDHGSLERAVARGAAAHGLARRGLGRRIGGGAAHAFYVGLAGAKPAAGPRAICLIPRGQEEGGVVDLQARPFTLTLGRPVQFPLYSTTSDRVDRPGDVVEIDEELHPLPPIHTVLKSAAVNAGAVAVHLRASLTVLGTLELWCVSNDSNDQWRLEFELRGAGTEAGLTVTESMPAHFADARALVERVFGGKPPPAAPRDVRQLVRSLEGVLGERETWPVPVLRELWSTLLAGASRRRRSPDHERVFFQLLGYSLRPGFGYPLDAWRCEQSFKLFNELVTFHAEQPNWNEFWVLWRRIAGGMGEDRQNIIWTLLKPHLARRIPPEGAKPATKPKGAQPEGLDEMVRVAAALEDIPLREKEQLGDWIALRLKNPATARGPWAWALGRIGTRWPLHGSGHNIVDRDRAAQWLQLLLTADLRSVDGVPFAIVTLARLTGDRSRDLDEELRRRAADVLMAGGAPARWRRLLMEVVEMEEADESQALGDTLPIGLQLH